MYSIGRCRYAEKEASFFSSNAPVFPSLEPPMLTFNNTKWLHIVVNAYKWRWISSVAIASLSSTLIGGKCRKTRSSAKSTSSNMSLEPPPRKVGSQNFGTIRPKEGYEKSLSFMALAQTVFGTDKKNTGGDSPPPHTPPPVIGLNHSRTSFETPQMLTALQQPISNRNNLLEVRSRIKWAVGLVIDHVLNDNMIRVQAANNS